MIKIQSRFLSKAKLQKKILLNSIQTLFVKEDFVIERKRKVKDKNIKNPTVKNILKMPKNNKN